MKKHLLSLLVLLMTTLSTHAYDFKSGDLYYNITSDTTVEVTYKSYDDFWGANGPDGLKITTATIPETVIYQETTYIVTSIGDGAFENCSQLSSITIPKSVIKIGNAFWLCTGLSSMIVETGNTIYDSRNNCNAIIETASNMLMVGCQTTTIPESVTSIGSGAFSGCSSLTSITIPNSVTSIGGNAFFGCSNLTSINIPNSVTSIEYSTFRGCSSLSSVTIGNSVTSIGNYAFDGCTSLTSISIPESVTSIGHDVFSGCSNLTSVLWNAKQCAFTYWYNDSKSTYYYGPFANICSQISSFTIGEKVESIPACLCYNMNKLTSITISESVTSIGGNAFKGCSSITSITIPKYIVKIGGGAFAGCSKLTSVIWNAQKCASTSRKDYNFGNMYGPFADISYLIKSFTIGEEVESIPNYLCHGMYNLTSIAIPNSVTSIGDSAFYNCSALTSITIPNSVTNIGEYTFEYCHGLASINIPNSVNSIGEGAFYSCSALTSVSIGNSVTIIGEHAFGNCSALTSMVVESSNMVYDSRDNCNAIIETATNMLIVGCQTTIVPNSVMSIGNGAFYNCSALPSITIPESLTSIGDSAFYNCSALTAIALPESVTNIGEYAFYNCSALISLTLPNSITSIKDHTFEYCYRLISIIIPNSVTSIGNYAFRYCYDLASITIPKSVTYIGEKTFYNCNSLVSVTSLSCTPPTCGNDVFYYTPSEKTLIVPSISTDAYKKSSIWEAFTSFDSIVYPSLSVQPSNNLTGTAQIEQDVDCDSVAIISAMPNYGYHFTQWSDGDTENPRTIKVTQDTTLTAEFAPNQYTLTTTANYTERGTTQGDTIADYLTELQVTATANYGYHFTQWSDGSTDNPHTISLKADMDIVAQFDKNQYTITASCNAEQGSISGTQEAEYLDEVTLTVLPNVGYHFTQWTDGNTDNPRTIKLTQDTTFTAEFAMVFSGKCGDDLYWAYSNKEVRITGTGAMYNYTDGTMPWTLLRDSIKTVRVGNNATSIGEYAFANTPKLAKLYIGANVEDIGAYAFTGCRRLYDIYCYPTYPPFGESNSFANYSVYLYIPCDYQRSYKLDLVWKMFLYIDCIGSEDVVVPDNEVTVSPNYEDATFIWPVTDGADTYSLVITKDDITFCTLVFDAQGQLVSIAFKPRRQNAPAADEPTDGALYTEQTANGFRFTVTGLEEGTDYAYTITVRNAANSVLETYTGEFTTLSNTPTGISDRRAEKLLRNGQVLIIRNGETYDMMGQRL